MTEPVEPEQTPAADSPLADYLQMVEQSFPGLQTWIDMQRQGESGVRISVYDRRRSAGFPVYIFNIDITDLRGLLDEPPDGRLWPGFNLAEFATMLAGGGLPPGFIVYQPESHT